MLQVRCFIGAYSKTFLSALRLREVSVECPTSVPDASCTNASFKGFLSSPAIFQGQGIWKLRTSNNFDRLRMARFSMNLARTTRSVIPANAEVFPLRRTPSFEFTGGA
jgi:hypothetical protein